MKLNTIYLAKTLKGLTNQEIEHELETSGQIENSFMRIFSILILSFLNYYDLGGGDFLKYFPQCDQGYDYEHKKYLQKNQKQVKEEERKKTV